MLFQVAGQHRFAYARIQTFFALKGLGAIVNTKPMMVHVMLVFGNERAFGACKAFDVAAHVLPIFHLRASHEIALLAILGFSEASISSLYVAPIHAGNTKRRFFDLLCLVFDIFR